MQLEKDPYESPFLAGVTAHLHRLGYTIVVPQDPQSLIEFRHDSVRTNLARGMGANTAVFALLDQVNPRLLPVMNPEELVELALRGSSYGSNTGSKAISYPMYKDFRDKNVVFSGVACRREAPLGVGVEGQAGRLSGELVSGNCWRC